MLETFATLLAAHLLADFVLQTGWIISNKRRASVMALHVAIVVVASAILTGAAMHPALLIIGATHLALDVWKQFFSKRGLRAFLIDQAGHVAIIAVVALSFPQMFAGGWWASPPHWTPEAARVDVALYLWWVIAASGYIATVIVGGYGIRLFVETLDYEDRDDPGLDHGGFYIGVFERTLVFALILANELAGIGFLVTAKGLLRMNVAQGKRKTNEYIIIGTLLSFGWAMLAALGTQAALQAVDQ